MNDEHMSDVASQFRQMAGVEKQHVDQVENPADGVNDDFKVELEEPGVKSQPSDSGDPEAKAVAAENEQRKPPEPKAESKSEESDESKKKGKGK